jgi:hypothetical protein
MNHLLDFDYQLFSILKGFARPSGLNLPPNRVGFKFSLKHSTFAMPELAINNVD